MNVKEGKGTIKRSQGGDVSIVSVGTSKGEERCNSRARYKVYCYLARGLCRSGTDQHAERFDAPSEFHRHRFRYCVTDIRTDRQTARRTDRQAEVDLLYPGEKL